MTRKNNHNFKFFKLTGLVLSCAVITACDQTFENPVGDTDSYSKGTADFSQFVTIGDSLTAGFADGSLYIDGQESSYPAILAKQFANVDTVPFEQPLVSDNLGGLTYNGVTDLNADGEDDFPKRRVFNLATSLPEIIEGTQSTDFTDLQTGAFNNFGVPGAKSFHLLSPTYGDEAGIFASPATANPYYIRFAPSTTTSMIAAATATPPSFYVLWAGNNDVLAYATGGGTGTDRKNTSAISPEGYEAEDITDPDYFTTVYGMLTSTFTDANANIKGVLLNIPDISALPFFTFIPYNSVVFESDEQANADGLNAIHASYNTSLQTALDNEEIDQAEFTKRFINFEIGANGLIVEDENLTTLSDSLPKMRHATPDDLILLTSSTVIDKDNPVTSQGLGVALADEFVLIPSEIEAIQTARTAFNNTIKTTADGNGNLAFVDVGAIMTELSTTGVNYGTGTITSTYVTGGGFSLDGVHPTARGYAHISNKIIEAINMDFGANIPPVNPNDYSTIFLKE